MAALTTSPEGRSTRSGPRMSTLARSRALVGLGGVLAVLVIWQAASAVGVLPGSTVPSMTAVAAALTALPSDAALWPALGATVWSWVIGVLITCVITIPVGLVLGSSRFARESTRSVIEFLKPIPPIAMIPLGLLLWGPSLEMKLILMVLGAGWPLLTQVMYGVQDVDEMPLKMARSYRLSRMRTIRSIIVPSISPFVVTGLRLAASTALIVAIVVEMVGGVNGLGSVIVQAETSGALAHMYALIVVAGVLGLVVNGLFGLLERRMLHWHPSQRTEVK